MENKIALITGATAGIGRALATIFAMHNYDVIITGRRQERLNNLQKELAIYNVRVLSLRFDIRNLKEVQANLGNLPNEWQNIDVLVNNAGLASGLNTIQDGDINDWEVMIDTNIKGLLYVTRTVSPYLIKNKKGHIINIASIAGKTVYPNGNVYCATKHAVDALSQAMRIDLLPHHIKVTNVAPGAVETEFSLVRYHGDEQKAKNVYKGFTPLKPEDIAETVYWIANRPAHVTINDIVIMPTAQATPRDVLKITE